MDINNLEKLDSAQLAGIIRTLVGASAPSGASNPPLAKRKRKTKKTTARIQYLTDEETAALIEAVRAGKRVRDVAIFELAWHRGLRASEVGLLELRHLRVPQGRLFVSRLKGGNSHEHLLSEREIRALKSWLRLRGQQPGPLFPSRNHGKAIGRKRLDQLMKEYGALANLPPEKRHFHCLRHTCGTSLHERDVDLREIQDHLGHSDIRNTQIYTQITEKKRKRTAERLFKEW